MESIEAFCDRYDACGDGKKWALENCSTMDDVWERAKPGWLIWIATQDGVLDDKTIRLFACWCVRQVWHLLDDERSRNAVVVSEKYANEEATKKELDIARDAAWAAEQKVAQSFACDAARGAALGTIWYDACDAARGAALGTTWHDARDAAWGAARDAARAAAWDAARDAAWDTARYAALALIVRDLITPEQFDILYGPWRSVMEETQ